jgi:hypothetical protein
MDYCAHCVASDTEGDYVVVMNKAATEWEVTRNLTRRKKDGVTEFDVLAESLAEVVIFSCLKGCGLCESST